MGLNPGWGRTSRCRSPREEPTVRRPRRPVPGLGAAVAARRAGAARQGVVALVRARGRPPGRRLPVRQRGGVRQRRDRDDVHAAGDRDRGRARRSRGRARGRDRRGQLSPALRPQRTERPAPGRPDLRAARRVGDGARADYTIPEWIDAPGLSYELLDAETEVAPGLTLVPTPGIPPGTSRWCSRRRTAGRARRPGAAVAGRVGGRHRPRVLRRAGRARPRCLRPLGRPPDRWIRCGCTSRTTRPSGNAER